MSYTKTVWTNGATALSDTNLNHIEQGIYDAHEFIDDAIDMIYPVGSIFMSVVNTNPGTYLTGTTWVAWGSGRVPVGVDTSQTEFDAVEETGGEKTVTLTTQQIPSHNHAYVSGGGDEGTGIYPQVGVGHVPVKSNTDNAGSGQAHNNLQPYITCYMWKRTA